MKTFSDQLAFTRNRPAGFDWLRICLASTIVAWHSIVTDYGPSVQHSFWDSPFWRPPLAAMLGMFFALSGFLVAGSLERCRSMVSFAGLRIMRIFPALVVEVLLSAFILGPILTHYNLASYFTGAALRHYLLNTLGLISFYLPGVFPNNPLPYVVNAQLWTVPFELRCYEALLVISILGFYVRKWLLVVLLVAATAMAAVYDQRAVDQHETLSGMQLVLCFLFGVALFRFRDRVIWGVWPGLLSAAVSVALLLIPRGDALAPIPLAYLTVYLGLTDPPRIALLFSGDYSYGMFLYGFPIQQALASAGPWARHWYVSMAIAFPLVIAFAATSWWFIEKPILTKKAMLIGLEDRILAAAGAGRAWWAQRPMRLRDRETVGPAENREG